MSEKPESDEERPCLHCLIADTIDDFYAEYGSVSGEKDTIDMDEIISALGKTIAELTYGSDAQVRQRIIEDLMREISRYEAEYASAPGSDMRHRSVTAATPHPNSMRSGTDRFQAESTLIDSHCHLDFPDFAGELEPTVQRAQAAGVTHMLTVSTRVRRQQDVLALAERFPNVY